MRYETRIAGLRRLFRLPPTPRSVDGEVEDELRFHIDMRTDELVARGLSREAARAEALRTFGDVREALAELSAIDRRRLGRERRAEWWEALGDDLRYAVRGLRRSPGFAAVAVATLALGIGANATMFGIVDRLLLRPPAYLRDASTTGRVYLTRLAPDGGERPESRTSYARFRDLRDGTRSSLELAANFATEEIMGTGDGARRVRVSSVSASVWPMFAARPALGRFFGPDEDREPTGAPVAVLGHALWRSAFGGDSAVLGREVRIGRTLYTVIGVAPPDFTGVELVRVDAWVPMTVAAASVAGPDYAARYNVQWLQLVARRRPGVSAAAANAALIDAYRRSMLKAPNARPLSQTRPRATLAPVLEDRGPERGESAKVATWLAGVSVIVLLIACANVANLLLARALRRQREIAVRLALGVSRARLLRLLLVEGLVLAALGGVAGLLIAQWGGDAVRRVLLPDVAWPRTLTDVRTLAAIAAAALACGLLTALAPALHALRPELAAALKAGAREGTFQRSRTRGALLVLQAALSVVLLVGAGLFMRSLHEVRTLPLGFDPARVALVDVDLRGTELTPRATEALYARLAERLRGAPGVERVGTAMTVPFWITAILDIRVPGIDSVEALGDFYANAVSGDYFAAMGTAVRRGRALGAGDRAGTPPVIAVSASMARRLWPGREPLGQCVKLGLDSVPCSTVVGVVEDLRHGEMARRARRGGDDPYQYYVPMEQLRDETHRVSALVVRVRGDPDGMVEPIHRELQPLVPGAAYVNVRTLQGMIDPEVRPWRLGATMFSAFGTLALVLSAVGLYGTIGYTVAQRTHELGVRIALGARTGHVLRLVVGEGVRVTAAGIALGLAAALVAGRYVAPLLFDTSPRDPAVLAGVAVTLLAVAVAASLAPAWRATRVDPNVALRAE